MYYYLKNNNNNEKILEGVDYRCSELICNKILDASVEQRQINRSADGADGRCERTKTGSK
jgi:hypothetical protein